MKRKCKEKITKGQEEDRRLKCLQEANILTLTTTEEEEEEEEEEREGK